MTCPDSPDFDTLRQLAADQQHILSTFATEVLLPPDASTPSSNPGSDDDSSVGLIAGLVTAGVVVLLVVMVIVIVGLLYCRVKHQKRYYMLSDI